MKIEVCIDLTDWIKAPPFSDMKSLDAYVLILSIYHGSVERYLP